MRVVGWAVDQPRLSRYGCCLSCKKNKIRKYTRLYATAGAPKSHIAVIGGGLAGLSTAIQLIDRGYKVSIYESRKVLGGKVASWMDKNGNHIEMGLHVFFGCYYELFGLMSKLGLLDNLLLKEHVHQYVNKGGDVAGLDFRWGSIGAPWNGIKAFLTTQQLNTVEKIRNAWVLATSPVVRGWIDYEGAMREIRALDKYSFAQWFLSRGGSAHSLERLWNPIAYALGFIDCHQISARCMLTIFLLFATRSEASVLRMLKGSPAQYLTHPMADYLQQKQGEIFLRKKVRQLIYQNVNGQFQVTGINVAEEAKGNAPGKKIDVDGVVIACDLRGTQRLLPQEFRKFPELDGIFRLDTVPVITVQLRFNGWVTELDQTKVTSRGMDNLLYSADADFSCFADLAITSPETYYKPGEGSLLQLVITPGDKYMHCSNEYIVETIKKQVMDLFPSSRNLKCIWSSVVKLGHSLYKEAPNCDVNRPQQETPISGLFLAGSYTSQDYIDSMEGAVKSGRLAAEVVSKKIPVHTNTGT
ncbi:hypothetical protein GpartN1_g5728.t1 [Galdieria partita]|uniref:Zeta-carotene desaturase, chloroplastic/chromoplastic n=1 Tax=Galdieria partita TaxID=83374 RepID=A0A9C7Q1Q7_9RHOD|nr:hypothetical protein GpartN1_g5728.t1 [Galdieria partita]